MSLFKNTVLSGSQFAGTGSTGGLFYIKTGHESVNVQINSLMFHTDAPCGYNIKLEDPDASGNTPLILSGTAGDVLLTNITLPTEDGYCWPLKFQTTGMTVAGYLVIDYSFVSTTPGA